MCGTPSYLAPEVVNQSNAEGYTSVVDSWSVGVIVFSMLTNSSPFIEDANQTNLRIRIIERVIDWDTLRNRGVSEAGKFLLPSHIEYVMILIHSFQRSTLFSVSWMRIRALV